MTRRLVRLSMGEERQRAEGRGQKAEGRRMEREEF
jgi:hypothetical protein